MVSHWASIKSACACLFICLSTSKITSHHSWKYSFTLAASLDSFNWLANHIPRSKPNWKIGILTQDSWEPIKTRLKSFWPNQVFFLGPIDQSAFDLFLSVTPTISSSDKLLIIPYFDLICVLFKVNFRKSEVNWLWPDLGHLRSNSWYPKALSGSASTHDRKSFSASRNFFCSTRIFPRNIFAL